MRKSMVLKDFLFESPDDDRIFPAKCHECMKIITYCQYWEKDFKCDMADILISMKGKWF